MITPEPNDAVVRAPSRAELARQAAAGLPAPPTIPDERRILALMGEVKRVGRWLVPQLFRVRAFLGSVKVDLRESEIPDGFILDVRAYGASVVLIIPPGVDVQFDVMAVMGNAINQAHEPIAGRSGAKAIRVNGSAFMGEVKVLVRERTS